ncbi:MAG: QueT transporter family protein [Clostridia bacterium]|nr:QueT transporter family protein [Clostridia bacterium]
MNKKVKMVCHAAIIAAIYVVLTYLTQSFASGAIQVRVAEALCVLPYFTAAAVPGVFVGCLLANIFTGCAFWDVILGSLATLIGAVCAYSLRRHKWLVPLPSVLANMIVVPPVLMYVYGANEAYPFLVATVGIGEIVSIYGLGMLLLFALEKRKNIFV